MNFKFTVLMSLLASTAEAHFRIPYPGERNATNWDTQTTSPCGGDNAVVLPRYDWNPKGSPVEINYHHYYGVAAIYFCGSDNCTTGADFNELIYEPVDQTKGNFCIPALQLPSKYNKVNSTGVVQIIYGAPSNKAGDYDFMYNCIDVIVSEDGPIFDGTQCSNSSSTIEYDEQVAQIEEENNDEQIDKITSMSYLEKVRISTQSANSVASNASKASATTSSDDMGGMNMSGMDMGTTSTTNAATTSKTGSSASASASGSASTSQSNVSTAGANNNMVTSSFIVLSLISLLI